MVEKKKKKKKSASSRVKIDAMTGRMMSPRAGSLRVWMIARLDDEIRSLGVNFRQTMKSRWTRLWMPEAPPRFLVDVES